MKKTDGLSMKMEDLIELVSILKVITDSMRSDHDAIIDLRTRMERIENELLQQGKQDGSI